MFACINGVNPKYSDLNCHLHDFFLGLDTWCLTNFCSLLVFLWGCLYVLASSQFYVKVFLFQYLTPRAFLLSILHLRLSRPKNWTQTRTGKRLEQGSARTWHKKNNCSFTEERNYRCREHKRHNWNITHVIWIPNTQYLKFHHSFKL